MVKYNILVVDGEVWDYKELCRLVNRKIPDEYSHQNNDNDLIQEQLGESYVRFRVVMIFDLEL